MSLQGALVVVQTPFPDSRLIARGEVIEWDGLDWKMEPTDAVEWEAWNASHRDDERVAANLRRAGKLEDMSPLEDLHVASGTAASVKGDL